MAAELKWGMKTLALATTPPPNFIIGCQKVIDKTPDPDMNINYFITAIEHPLINIWVDINDPYNWVMTRIVDNSFDPTKIDLLIDLTYSETPNWFLLKAIDDLVLFAKQLEVVNIAWTTPPDVERVYDKLIERGRWFPKGTRKVIAAYHLPMADVDV